MHTRTRPAPVTSTGHGAALRSETHTRARPPHGCAATRHALPWARPVSAWGKQVAAAAGGRALICRLTPSPSRGSLGPTAVVCGLRPPGPVPSSSAAPHSAEDGLSPMFAVGGGRTLRGRGGDQGGTGELSQGWGEAAGCPLTLLCTQGPPPVPPGGHTAQGAVREGEQHAGRGQATPHLDHHLKGEDTREDVVQVFQGLKPKGAPLRARGVGSPALRPHSCHAALTLFLGESVRTGSSAARAMLLRAMTTRMTISKYLMVTM